MLRVLFHLACIACMLCPGSAFGETLRFTTDEIFPRSSPQGTGFEDIILKEAFGRLGLGISVVYLPSERALINVNEGIDDGNFVRVAGLEQKFPNLVMVPERVCDIIFTAFTRRKDIRISDWESLKPYNVGLVNGWQYPEKRLPQTRSLIRVRDDEALFELLSRDRADVVIHELNAGRMLIKKMGLTGIVALDPPLARPDMYLYLNKRHAGLVPGLADILREMRADGTIQGIIDSVLREAGLQ